MATLSLKLFRNEQRAIFGEQKDLMQMRFTLRCIQCMLTSILRDQQCTFGVRSLLVAEKAMLMRNDLADMLLRRLMPQLPQLMLSNSPTSELGQYVEKLNINV